MHYRPLPTLPLMDFALIVFTFLFFKFETLDLDRVAFFFLERTLDLDLAITPLFALATFRAELASELTDSRALGSAFLPRLFFLRIRLPWLKESFRRIAGRRFDLRRLRGSSSLWALSDAGDLSLRGVRWGDLCRATFS